MATSLPLPQVLRSVVARHATRSPEDLQEGKLRCAFVGKMRREAPILVNRKVARRQVYSSRHPQNVMLFQNFQMHASDSR